MTRMSCMLRIERPIQTWNTKTSRSQLRVIKTLRRQKDLEYKKMTHCDTTEYLGTNQRYGALSSKKTKSVLIFVSKCSCIFYCPHNQTDSALKNFGMVLTVGNVTSLSKSDTVLMKNLKDFSRQSNWRWTIKMNS